MVFASARTVAVVESLTGPRGNMMGVANLSQISMADASLSPFPGALTSTYHAIGRAHIVGEAMEVDSEVPLRVRSHRIILLSRQSVGQHAESGQNEFGGHDVQS